MINEKTLVSSVTLLASLGTYFYAKVTHKDAVPYVMVGGFIGAMIGEAISGMMKKNEEDDDNNKKEGQ
ncbi:MAG: hypothetical protein K0S33_3743 [Bacteroidetes bacterium]|jgi:hypothetical protein|nr:hypothetical protein [Bacteroidota bacterium]